MSPAGRPKGTSKPNSKHQRLELRLSDSEYEMIGAVAEMLHISRTEAILRGIALLKAEAEKNQ